MHYTNCINLYNTSHQKPLQLQPRLASPRLNLSSIGFLHTLKHYLPSVSTTLDSAPLRLLCCWLSLISPTPHGLPRLQLWPQYIHSPGQVLHLNPRPQPQTLLLNPKPKPTPNSLTIICSASSFGHNIANSKTAASNPVQKCKLVTLCSRFASL